MAYHSKHTGQTIDDAVDTVLGLAPVAKSGDYNDLENAPELPQRAVLLTATLDKDDWADNEQTLTISGLEVSGYSYVVVPSSASALAYGEALIYADDVTTANRITFHCDAVPGVNIGVTILKVEVA